MLPTPPTLHRDSQRHIDGLAAAEPPATNLDTARYKYNADILEDCALAPSGEPFFDLGNFVDISSLYLRNGFSPGLVLLITLVTLLVIDFCESIPKV